MVVAQEDYLRVTRIRHLPSPVQVVGVGIQIYQTYYMHPEVAEVEEEIILVVLPVVRVVRVEVLVEIPAPRAIE
jgi:hypothetical protein